MSADLQRLAELLAQALPRALAVDIAGSGNTTAGRDIRNVTASRKGIAVAGNYFEVHLHISAPRTKRGDK